MKRFTILIISIVVILLTALLPSSAHEIIFNEKDFSVTVTGIADEIQSGKYATVMLLDEEADFDLPLPENIVYIGQTQIQEDGSYEFKFAIESEINIDNCYVRVKCNGEDISSSIEHAYAVIDNGIEYKLKIKNDGENFTVEATSDGQNSNYKAYVSFVDNKNKVLNTSIIKDTSEIFEFSKDFDFAKVFLWKDNLKPLMLSHRILKGANISTVNVCYPGFTSKALTFSFDDDPASDAKLIEIFNKYNIKGTFNAVGTIDHNDPSVYDGHEVISHGVKHLDMGDTKYTTEECIFEIVKEKETLREIFGDDSAKGFVWPYTAPIDRDDFDTILQAVRDNYDYCRETPSSGNFKLPTDWHRWAPTCKHDTMNTYLPQFLKYDGDELILFYIWGHAFEFTPNYGGDWSQIEEFLEALKGENFWSATNGEIHDYVMASKKLVVNKTSVYNPTDIDIYVKLNGVNTVVGAKETVYATSAK